MSALVRSRERVTNHGEVYTPEHLVNAMLDLVKNETQRIDSRFLEPACGHGNFLVEILRRKLDAVTERYKRIQYDYEAQSILAVSSIYGIDLLRDNVEEARNRLFDIYKERYFAIYKNRIKEDCLASVRYILEKNIIRGDALKMTVVQDHDSPALIPHNFTLDSLRETEKPIVFSQWSLITSSKMKRQDFIYGDLVNNLSSGSLFADLGEEATVFEPVKDYPPVHFLKISHAYESI